MSKEIAELQKIKGLVAQKKWVEAHQLAKKALTKLRSDERYRTSELIKYLAAVTYLLEEIPWSEGAKKSLYEDVLSSHLGVMIRNYKALQGKTANPEFVSFDEQVHSIPEQRYPELYVPEPGYWDEDDPWEISGDDFRTAATWVEVDPERRSSHFVGTRPGQYPHFIEGIAARYLRDNRVPTNEKAARTFLKKRFGSLPERLVKPIVRYHVAHSSAYENPGAGAHMKNNPSKGEKLGPNHQYALKVADRLRELGVAVSPPVISRWEDVMHPDVKPKKENRWVLEWDWNKGDLGYGFPRNQMETILLFPTKRGAQLFAVVLTGREKNPDEKWLQDADEEMEEEGTVGAFTKQARRAGYDDTMEYARKVMKGWRSGKKTVYNKKTRKQQKVTKKTMYRANFAINAQKRNPSEPPYEEKICPDEAKQIKKELKKHKGKKGPYDLEVGSLMTYQDKAWRIYDFDADASVPGGVTIVLVSRDLSRMVVGLPAFRSEWDFRQYQKRRSTRGNPKKSAEEWRVAVRKDRLAWLADRSSSPPHKERFKKELEKLKKSGLRDTGGMLYTITGPRGGKTGSDNVRDLRKFMKNKKKSDYKITILKSKTWTTYGAAHRWARELIKQGYDVTRSKWMFDRAR